MIYNEFKEAVFAHAQAVGLKDYELYYTAGESVSVSVFQSEVNGFGSTTELGVCFRCLVDGKMGYASTSLLSAEEAVRVVEAAMENARTIESEELCFIHPGDAEYATLTPKEVTEPSTEEMVNYALELQKTLYATDNRVVDGTMSGVDYATSELAIDNSYGLSLRDTGRMAQVMGMVVLQDGEPYDGYQVEIGSLGKLDKAEVAKKAVDKAACKVGGEVGPTGTFPVLLTPGAMRSLLSVFSAVFSAENTQKGLSLLAGKEGEVIAADCVTLMDDPFYADSYAQASFDAEGCATSTKAVIENGVLKTLLHNLKTAHVAGVKTTANASKAGYAATVGISPYNFYIAPGEKSQDELLAQMGNGVIVDSFGGLHAGASAVSGDFSLQSTGFLVENGQKGKYIHSFTVAGNFFDLLKKIVAVGSDLELGRPGGNTCLGSPSLLIDQLSLAGK